MKITTTYYNVGMSDPHVQSAILRLLQEGNTPSRIGIRQVKRYVEENFRSYGLSVDSIEDLNGDVPDDDDPIWDKMHAVAQRLGLE